MPSFQPLWLFCFRPLSPGIFDHPENNPSAQLMGGEGDMGSKGPTLSHFLKTTCKYVGEGGRGIEKPQ